jgi:hypothetical protein
MFSRATRTSAPPPVSSGSASDAHVRACQRGPRQQDYLTPHERLLCKGWRASPRPCRWRVSLPRLACVVDTQGSASPDKARTVKTFALCAPLVPARSAPTWAAHKRQAAPPQRRRPVAGLHLPLPRAGPVAGPSTALGEYRAPAAVAARTREWGHHYFWSRASRPLPALDLSRVFFGMPGGASPPCPKVTDGAARSLARAARLGRRVLQQ